MPSDPELAACFSDELNFADYDAPSILRLGAALSFTSGRLAGSSFLKVALEDAKYFSWLNVNGPASRTYVAGVLRTPRLRAFCLGLISSLASGVHLTLKRSNHRAEVQASDLPVPDLDVGNELAEPPEA